MARSSAIATPTNETTAALHWVFDVERWAVAISIIKLRPSA
jgi:hypothetical protein